MCVTTNHQLYTGFGYPSSAVFVQPLALVFVVMISNIHNNVGAYMSIMW